ncbi:alpha/beta hydrolase [Catenulispora subtropica]|uniref:alpha/beta hydrolase n=1 Tax=Catenulispora subtropica TaxID=450798 RepID=UPI0031DAB003
MGVAAVPARAAEDKTCTDVRLPVALAPGSPRTEVVDGTLCLPAAGTTQVDVLIHGAGYNRTYWDWPVAPDTYSYVDKTLAAGRATFAYDRVGAGASSHPLSVLLTPQADAYVLHQVVVALRQRGFATVDAVGHSFGSIVAVQEAAAFHDTDRLVVTGLLHDEKAVAPPASIFYPARNDPQFAGRGLDPGYVTTEPGTRGPAFFSASADPQVIAYDEAHKDTASATDLAIGLPASQLPPVLNAAAGVTEPVLVLDGRRDGLFCGSTVDCADVAGVAANERSFYTSAPSVDVVLVPETGHSVALHPSAGESFGMIDTWISGH